MTQPTNYRVQYDEIVPGGSVYHQDDLIRRGTVDDVRAYLAQRNVIDGSVRVTAHTESDGFGVPVDLDATS